MSPTNLKGNDVVTINHNMTILNPRVGSPSMYLNHTSTYDCGGYSMEQFDRPNQDLMNYPLYMLLKDPHLEKQVF